ncbi:MAG: amidase [Anaerolineae bacterium]
MTELTSLTISQAAKLMSSGELSPVELTHAFLDRIGRLDPQLNSFITVTAEAALEQAKQAEANFRNGNYLDILHGIPLAVKDLFALKGTVTTAGAKAYSTAVETADCAVVATLRKAGATFLGKTNMHEYAFGVINDNPHFGTCRNPWDSNRSPGGSSGGNGAALSADLCMGALGSDTRGSIRIPAALCGIVGLKPTIPAVNLDGVVTLSWSLDHTGPMARTVEDVAVLYMHLTNGYRLRELTMNPTEPLQSLRIGVPADDFFREADPEIIAAFDAAIGVFAGLGAKIVPVNLNFLRETVETSKVIVSADAAAFHRERLEQQPEQFGADVLARLRLGQQYTGVDYALARRAQRLLFLQFYDLFQRDPDKPDNLHVLLTPTTPVVAPRLDDAAELDTARTRLSWFTAPFNMTGNPAISVPCGFTRSGLPIGLQIITRYSGESTLLYAAYAYEQATDWHTRKPAL